MASDAAERRAAELVALLRLSDPLSGERIYVVNVADAMEPAIATALDAHASEAAAELRTEVERLRALLREAEPYLPAVDYCGRTVLSDLRRDIRAALGKEVG